MRWIRFAFNAAFRPQALAHYSSISLLLSAFLHLQRHAERARASEEQPSCFVLLVGSVEAEKSLILDVLEHIHDVVAFRNVARGSDGSLSSL